VIYEKEEDVQKVKRKWRTSVAVGTDMAKRGFEVAAQQQQQQQQQIRRRGGDADGELCRG
jgi:hypothetical protein